MKITTLLTTTSLAMLGLTTVATAHDDEGWYLRGNLGYGIHQDVDLSEGLDSSFHGNGLQSEGNAAGSLGFGYDFGNNWRLELDGDTLWTDLGSISQTPGSSAKLRTNSAMLNAIYDFDEFGQWEPYIGAGIGVIEAQANLFAHDTLNPFGAGSIIAVNEVCAGPRASGQGESCAVNDSDTGLGWQLLAGLGYSISENLKWDTHYTYQDASDFEFGGVRTNGITGNQSPFDTQLDDVGSHSLVTGFRYLFGHKHDAVAPVRTPAPTREITQYKCWDGAIVSDINGCAQQTVTTTVQQYRCWDGEVVSDINGCKPQTVTREVTRTREVAVPQVVQQRTNLNVCGSSNVGIFNVNTSATPKQLSRLGTLPEFGDSHGLSPDQFFQKLQTQYNSNATDKAYLNHLFKSMGYSNGFADAQSYMFSEETLPVGTAGLLGLGKQHHFNYSILPSNDRDREAFRIQSANGTVVHFMKTCGNYFYGCE